MIHEKCFFSILKACTRKSYSLQTIVWSPCSKSRFLFPSNKFTRTVCFIPTYKLFIVEFEAIEIIRNNFWFWITLFCNGTSKYGKFSPSWRVMRWMVIVITQPRPEFIGLQPKINETFLLSYFTIACSSWPFRKARFIFLDWTSDQ